MFEEATDKAALVDLAYLFGHSPVLYRLFKIVLYRLFKSTMSQSVEKTELAGSHDISFIPILSKGHFV